MRFLIAITVSSAAKHRHISHQRDHRLMTYIALLRGINVGGHNGGRPPDTANLLRQALGEQIGREASRCYRTTRKIVEAARS